MKRLRGNGPRGPFLTATSAGLAAAFLVVGCHQRAPGPVPAASASVPLAQPLRAPARRSICSGSGGPGDSGAGSGYAAWFPPSAGFCIDPNADQRVFGEKGLALRDAAEILTLDVERLERLGLREVVTLTYVEDREEPARVAASVLRFSSADGAYAFFTERLAEATELGRPPFRPIKAGAGGVLGDATALAVRDNAVLRLDFTSPGLTPERVTAAAEPVLPALAQAIAENLPGEPVPPPAARLLPEPRRVALSLRYDALDLLGMTGVGPGAVASYSDGTRRFRLALFAKKDADAAEDVLRTLRKRPDSRKVKNGPYDATRVVELEPKSGAGIEWIFGQKGNMVGGASLDAAPRAAPRGAPPERDRAILEMKRLLDGFHGAGPW